MGNAEVEIRTATDLDVAGIAAVAAACQLTTDPTGEMAKPQAALLVACRQGEVLGFCVGWFVADELQIIDVGVVPQARRRGLGRALLESFLAEAQARGVVSGILEVRADNAAARTLYRSLGFSDVGSRARYYPDGADAILMRIDLCSSMEQA